MYAPVRVSWLFVGALLIALSFLTPGEAHATGVLYVRPLGSSSQHTPMPIRTYDATTEIHDQIAVTHVDQLFTNPTGSLVESTFIFPLPEGAVITELAYWFNGKRYVGSIRERQEAQQAYNNKIRKYLDPALLQYFGKNQFKLNIAPINPHSDVRFEITYVELLPYDFGTVQYRFPLRTTDLSPTPVERVSVEVTAHTNSIFTLFTSPSHTNAAECEITAAAPNEYHVLYGDENFTPDRDLILQFETVRSELEMNVLTYNPVPADSMGTDGFYALWITPPNQSGENNLPPRDIVFTADVSSSMEGERLVRLKEALNVFLDALNENDRFNIVIFSTNVVTLSPDLVQVTDSILASARTFVDRLSAVGLTNFQGAFGNALSLSFQPDRNHSMIFMTDGVPTWGTKDFEGLIDWVRQMNTAQVPIYPFGIGDDIDKAFLDYLALENAGYATYITASDSIPIVVRNFLSRISLPALYSPAIDYGGLNVYDIYPAPPPALFAGSQAVQFGRYGQGGRTTLTLTGTMLETPVSFAREVEFPGIPGGNRAVARLWAKQKIDYLLREIELYGEHKELIDAIINLSIRFGILTPYTALYADPDEDNGDATTGVDEKNTEVKAHVTEVRPNPFRDRTTITFTIPNAAAHQHVTVTVYDMFGRVVRVLFDQPTGAGTFQVDWDGTDGSGIALPSGTYLVKVENGSTLSTTMIHLTR